jgi:hypothetical protein
MGKVRWGEILPGNFVGVWEFGSDRGALSIRVGCNLVLGSNTNAEKRKIECLLPNTKLAEDIL